MSEENSTSLTRAIAVLNALGTPEAVSGEGVGVMRIARLVGKEKSQVSRTLKTLADAGFVSRDPETLQYRLGWRMFALASAAGDQQLRTLAPPILRKLVARLGERAHLSVLKGTDVLTVLSESPAKAIQATGWVGRVTPPHCTSAGKALLVDRTETEVRALLRDVEFGFAGPNEPADIEQLLARLRTARKQGYASSNEEFETELVGIAAPVRDFRGHTVAALNISAPKFRIGRSLTLAGRELKTAADYLSQMLTENSGSNTADDRRIS